MKIPLVDVKRSYETHKIEIDQAISKVIDSAAFILGPQVEHFESNFAKFCQVKYCVGTDSGLSALELGMRALGIGEGNEVITPVNSFIASSSAISFTGAKPVWVDVHPKTYNIDPSLIKRKINSRTKAIMLVHLYGQPAEIDSVIKIAKKHKLKLIEDACQAHGATYKGKKIGQFGDFAAFSFYPGKNLGAFGDAGSVVTNNLGLAEKIRQMRNYGQKKKYQHKFLAFNRRMDTIQATILNVKLKYLEEANQKRIALAKKYFDLLKDLPLILPNIAPNRIHVFHLFVIQTQRRNQLLQFLKLNGVDVGIHYPIPIHLQDAYQAVKGRRGQYPVAEGLADKIISLPIFPEMTKNEVTYVAQKIRQFFKA